MQDNQRILFFLLVEDWYNYQISNLLQKKTTKTKQWINVGNKI